LLKTPVLPCATSVVTPSELKKLVKDKEISEDEERRAAGEIDELTNKFVAEIDQGQRKEKDLMAV
jgi:ribosome recycling factor